ncbi:hypothetical protein N7491_004624 [Penicillium cf. griseofulvum]|uniref:Copper-fist domain-containing protein n=1 Tax=Penicillium cf. griseofulvum TaxID=2972120 RepID=A0A9W9J0T5_9EURO|nr:hypothetical protein N7472_007314 [Penicillium cf. griseofulvum]KAJ5434029.1 hypothetical protein N7491_004624 [Penicillium cf. griseofulvum]KAJ5451861.1 hypothetical protein N7445_000044 [Penicillium cf. griseofulvum]
MPLDEEGAKWSCEPCIRGHRSSKCQHFDRLMMKVPKAGRPLAKCPHPKGTCSCQKSFAVMVRIPKGSSCLCRPLYKVPMDANDSTQSPPSSMVSTSSPAPGKVQKSGRRQSTMHAAPENIARALENMPGKVKLEDGTPNLISDFSSQPGLDGSHKSSTASTQNQKTPSPTETTREGSQSPQVSSCCSQKQRPKPPSPTPARTAAVAPSQNGGSCCGGPRPSTTNQAVYSQVDQQQFQQPLAWGDQSYMQFPMPQMSPWQNSSIPTHGDYMHSAMHQAHPQHPSLRDGYMGMLLPHSQPQIPPTGMSYGVTSPPSMAYSNPMSGLGITQPSMDPYMLNNIEPSYDPPPGGDPCHDCRCGEDCQCLGCAAHPFNTTTRKHVQEMGAIITSNGDDKNPEVINPYQTSPYQGGTPSTPFPYFMHSTPSMDRGFQPIPFDSYSDPNSALASGYSSPLSANHQLNQQLMHPSEYYTLEYPVGLPNACSDTTGSCQCGSDCSCVGCLTHSGHNGLSLDVPIPEHPISNTADKQAQPSRHASHTSSATSQSSRIPVLDNVSVPCLSPRTLETSMI